MSALYDVRSVEYLGGYRLRVDFADGSRRLVELAGKLAGPVGPIFESLRDEKLFALAAVDAEMKTVVWPNGADLAPDALHSGAFDPTGVS